MLPGSKVNFCNICMRYCVLHVPYHLCTLKLWLKVFFISILFIFMDVYVIFLYEANDLPFHWYKGIKLVSLYGKLVENGYNTRRPRGRASHKSTTKTLKQTQPTPKHLDATWRRRTFGATAPTSTSGLGPRTATTMRNFCVTLRLAQALKNSWVRLCFWGLYSATVGPYHTQIRFVRPNKDKSEFLHEPWNNSN
jgi:hypothetical protein